MIIKEEIGELCLTMEASFLLIKKIKAYYTNNEDITLDFSDITIYATPFFNGLLHGVDELSDISLLNCINLPDHGTIAYDHAVNNFVNKESQDNVKKALKGYLDSQNN
jgi:hypothetical protein